jgi:hypothetical protein
MLGLYRAAAGVLAAGAILAATPAVCADAPPPPNAHSLELARQLFAEMHMDQMMGQMMKAMIPAIAEQARKANPSLTADQAKAIDEAVAESSIAMMSKMIDRVIPLYASTFTEKELQDTVNFYSTPSGQAMLTKMPTLAVKMAPMVAELMPEMTTDLRTRMCAKTDCSKMKAPPSPGA